MALITSCQASFQNVAGCRIRRRCFTDWTEKRIYFLLVGTDDNIWADTALIILYCEV